MTLKYPLPRKYGIPNAFRLCRTPTINGRARAADHHHEQLQVKQHKLNPEPHGLTERTLQIGGVGFRALP